MLEKKKFDSFILFFSSIFYMISLIFKKICIILACISFLSTNLLFIDLYIKTKNNEPITTFHLFLIGFCLINTFLYFTLNHFDKIEQTNLNILEELKYRNDEEDKMKMVVLKEFTKENCEEKKLTNLEKKENNIVK